MKKILSMLLAFAIIASAIPVTLVSATSEYDVKIVFGGTTGGGNPTKSCDLDGTAAGYTVVASETTTAKGDNRQTTIGNTGTIVQQIDIGTGDAWVDRTENAYDSMFTFTVPISKSGSYSLKLIGGNWYPGAEFFVYVNGKYAGYYNFTDSVTTNKKPVLGVEKTMNTLWLEEGNAKISFVLARKTQYYQWGNRALPISLSLDFVGEKTVSYSKIVNTLPSEIAVGETVPFTVYALMSDGSQFRANGYEMASDGKAVASTKNSIAVSVMSGDSINMTKTSEDLSYDGVYEGTVTASKEGKTEIALTATINGSPETIVHTINVVDPDNNRSGVNIFYNPYEVGYGFYLGDFTYEQSNGFYRSHSRIAGWDPILTDFRTNGGYMVTSHKAGQWYALGINVPVSGFYDLSLIYAQRTYASTEVDVYLLDSEEAKNVEANLTASNLLETVSCLDADGKNYEKTGTIEKENVNFENAGEYVLVISSKKAGYSAIGSLTLSGGENLAVMHGEIALSDENVLNVSGVLSNKAKTVIDFKDTEVTFISKNPGIAKVTDGTKLEVLGNGNATIEAEVIYGENEYVFEKVFSFAGQDTGIGEAADETVSVYVAAENGGDVTSDDITIGNANTVNTGKTITVTANETETLVFSHWRNASGKVISDKPEYTFTANTNTALIAVYDSANNNSDEVVVSFYNQYKGLITSKNVAKGTTFASASEDVDTKLTGHEFSNWSIANDTVINSITRAVALYKVANTEYTASFYDGDTETPKSIQKGKYGDEVSYVATSENFSYWILGDESECVVSYDKEISFYLWGDISLIAVYEGEKEALPTINLDKEGNAYFITYNTPEAYEKLEAGIIFSKSGTPTVNSCYSRALSENGTPSGQFTALPSENENVARGFLMVKDSDGEVRVIYTDIIE
ncbi:MAG: hypothetical protein IJF32_13775 [Oscillospiraceae bacterium]|nr:hypothetical protein [Oscillospiraceae bacterium]